MDRKRGVPLLFAFLALEGGLYVLFLLQDLSLLGGDSMKVKYLSILLCLTFSAWGNLRGGEGLITAALALTAGADWFLLVLNRHYLVGVGLFCLVQGLYLVHIRRERGSWGWWPGRLLLWAGGMAVLCRLGLLVPLTALAALYISNFFWNILDSRSLGSRGGLLFFLGLVLFFCCDLCVGVHNAPGLFPVGLTAFARVGMWLFYLPAQVLITLSGLPEEFFGRTEP